MKKYLLSLAVLATATVAMAQGTAENPMSVDEVLKTSVDTKIENAYVKGYIVGYLPSGSGISIKDVVFGTDGAAATNLVLAGTSSEDDYNFCIPVQLPSGDVRTALNLETHPENLGHEIILTGSIEKYFGSIGVKSVSAYQWVGDAPEYTEPDEVGTKDAPISVTEFITLPNNATKTWVNGVIVGSINGMSTDNVVFGQGAHSGTNIVIAANADVKDLAQCIAVQLPKGDVRDALNLSSVPENLYKTVTLFGTHESYFGMTGLKNVSEFVLGGATTPVDPPVTANVIYETLSEDATECDWTFEDVSLAEGLSYVWSWKTYNEKSYLNASAYLNGTNYAADSYAISPVISLAETTAPKVSFEHAAKFQNANLAEEVTFLVREEGASDWTALTVPTYPEAGSWTFVNSGDIDLSAYAGKKIQLAFHYVSTSAAADTWEGKNLKITDGTTETPVTPDVNVVYETLSEDTAECDWTFEDVSLAEGLSYVWSWKTYNEKSYLNASAYLNGTNYAADSYAISPVISLAETTAPKVSFEHAAKFQNANLAEEVTFLVREEGASDWTALTVPTYPEAGSWTFVNSGDIDLSAYAGKKIQLAFHYVSTSAAADTWEGKNLKITDKAESAVSVIEAAEDGEAIYFDIRGVRVANPENGLYIKVQGNRATKVLIRK